ncbi:MAG: HD domain-containing protein [Lachnospiraceae bacterium]|nr:HD domain-containing protein [Lachnospiraceae bacterium]
MKTSKIVSVTLISLIINLAGKAIADRFSLPFWLDSFGTVASAYILGPVSGAAVGLTTNLIYGVVTASRVTMIYGLINMCIGFTVGLCSRKKMMNSLFGAMFVSMIVTLVSILFSFPLNMIFSGGRSGNYFGDGVTDFLMSNHIPAWPACIVGEFYIDFADKLLTMAVFFAAIKLYRFIRKKRAKAAALLIPFIIIYTLSQTAVGVRAEEDDEKDFNFYSYTQSVYSSDNGLPCGEANDVVQTNDGTLWIGTYAGLYRYNGSEFKWMSEFDSVKNVNCLYVDIEGRLWTGTNDNGLTISIGDSVSNVVDMSEGLPSNSVRSIVRGSDGIYYVGTSDALQIIRLSGGLTLLDPVPEILYAHSVAADEKGNVAAVTAKGELFILNGGKIMSGPFLNSGEEIYTCCTFDDNGLLYVGTSGMEIYSFILKDETPVKKEVHRCVGLTQINSLTFDDKAHLYVCTDNGVGFFNGRWHFTRVNTPNFSNSIDNMAIDYQGNYWFTSSRLGLLRVSKAAFTDLYGLAGMQRKVANSVTQWNKRLYVGTDTGLDVLSADNYSRLHDTFAQSLGDVRVRCVFVDSKDRLWVCTYGKGLIMSTGGGEPVYFNQAAGFTDRVRAIAENIDGSLIASGDKGVAIIKNDRISRIFEYSTEFSSAMILSILCEKDGTVLLGSDGDGIVILKEGEVESHVTMADGLSSDVILRIVAASDESGWFIVTSNGLCFMDREGSIRILKRFPYFNNYDMVINGDGKAFVLGSAGIYIANEAEMIEDSYSYSCELLDSRRGLNTALTANSWNYTNRFGQLYLSCDKGIYLLDMDDYGSEQRSYRMKLSSALIDGELHDIERGAELLIDSDASRIELFPEILNYTVEDPGVIYMLEGFDTEPKIVKAGELSEVVYTNLPAGSYVFHMAILDNDNNVIEESRYPIIKQMKVYDRPWFKVYMLTVAAIAIAWFTWFIARTQIQRTLNFQKKELEFARKQLEMGNETILAIAKTVDAKDENTSQHSQRVSEYSVLLAKELGFTPEECENIRKAALLHDIGKISIPDKILNKPAKLDDAEYAIMKTHVEKGAEILKDFTLVEHVVEGALYHHERYDGSGYTHGLAGDDIPLYGRIIGVADAFDAMTQNRVYRKSLDMDTVVAELKKGRGTQFDPRIADIMLRLLEEGKVNPDSGGTGIADKKDGDEK